MQDQKSENADLSEFLGTKASPMRRTIRIGAVVLAPIVFGLIMLRCTAPPMAAAFVTEPVTRGDISVTVSATGNLAPTNQIDVGSELSGIVEQVLVDVNARVTRGQTLAVLDTSRLNDQVLQSQASLASAEASVTQARTTLAEAEAQLARFEEVRRLSGGRVPSDTELTSQNATVARARANLLSVQANVAAAQAQLSSNRTQVGKAVIRSPVSGVVLRRSIDPGQTVQAAFNTPSLFIIAEDLTQMRLEVAVDEADVSRVREGMPATFTVDAYPGRSFTATVSRVSLGARNTSGGTSAAANTTSSSNVVSYLANLTVVNDDLSLRPGMTATAQIQSDTTAATLIVPNAALRFTPPPTQPVRPTGFSIRPPDASQSSVAQERGIGEGSTQFVYVLGTDRSLRQVTVVTGPTDGRNTTVTAQDLEVGAMVVTGQRATNAGG